MLVKGGPIIIEIYSFEVEKPENMEPRSIPSSNPDFLRSWNLTLCQGTRR